MAIPSRRPDQNADTVLPAVATNAAPTYTEGDAVPLSVDLNGTLRTTAGGGGGAGDASAANQTTMIGHLDGVEGLLTTIDGDTGTLVTSNAAIQAAVEGTLDVNIVSGAGSGGTAAADDADFTAGTTSGTPAMGVYESTPTSVTDGDLGTVGITSGRRLKTSATIDAALPAGTNAIGKLAANSGVDIGDVDVTSCALPTGASTAANQTTIIGHLDGVEGILTTMDADTGAISLGVGGTADAAATAGSVGSLNAKQRLMTSQLDSIKTAVETLDNAVSGTGVNVSQLNGVAVTMGNGASGTGVQRVTLANDSTGVIATVSTVTTVSTLTGGGIAHDSADSGNPHKIGAKAETSPKGITLVADADRTDLYADADGLQMVKLNTSGADAISESISNTDGASTAFTNFSAVASTKNYITSYTAFRTDAGTSMAYIDLRDGIAGSVLWRIPLPPLSGSISPPYNGPCLFKTSANTALAFDVSSALSTVYLSVSGYQSKV
jgi:hypothetical protein